MLALTVDAALALVLSDGIFRVPLNAAVVALELASLTSAAVFLVCTLLLLASLVCFALAHLLAPASQPSAQGSASTQAKGGDAPLLTQS
jgi:hypothetical protein